MKKRYAFLILLIIILILVVCSFLLLLIKPKGESTEYQKEQEQEIIKDYIYKIKYRFSDDYYITVKQEEIIEVYHKTKIYEECEGTNCLKETGKYKEETITMDYNPKIKEKVLNTLNEIYTKAGTQDIDADNMDLTSDQQRILLAMILDNEDMITIEEDIKYKTETSTNTLKNGTTIYHRYSLLDSTNNEILNKIKEDLNKKIQEDYQNQITDFNKDIDLYEKSNLKEVTGIYKDLSLYYVGPYSIVFVDRTGIPISGIVNPNTKIKSYVYNYAGEIKEFPQGWRTKYYEKAISNFMTTDTYRNFRSDFLPDWKNTIRDNMFETGNWAIEEGKVTFVLPGSLIGIVPLEQPVITLEVDIEEDF